MDKTPQIAEEQLVNDDGQSLNNKASKIQKLVFRCFLLTSAKAKKFQDGDRLTRLYTAIVVDVQMIKKNIAMGCLECQTCPIRQVQNFES